MLKNGQVVRSQSFKVHQIIGNPINTISRLSNWNVDEIVLLDISLDDNHDLRRDDKYERYNSTSVISLLKQIADVCFAPLAFGGRIRSLEDIRERLSNGADKCVINSQALENPMFITKAAERFGSQCITVSIDVLRHKDGKLEVFSKNGSHPTGITPEDWACEAEERGAGEIFLNSIDRDGSGAGYDLDLIRSVTSAVKSIPVIACGGVGDYNHFPEGITIAGAAAVAAANIFHFREVSYPIAKQACLQNQISMRAIELDSQWTSREPIYNFKKENERLSERMKKAKTSKFKANSRIYKNITWCSKCVYPSISATPMEYDDNQVCMGCRTASQKEKVQKEDWNDRKQKLIDLIEKNHCPDGSQYDCVIPVSGGKDSYFQTHYIKNVLGFNPLLITYYGNNYSDVGERNLQRMRKVFDVDHIIIRPEIEILKKLNRLGFKILGDMNWHAHMGIVSVPMRIALEKKIPIVIWGENTWSDLAGQNSMSDFCERNYRHRLEHDLRGFEWNYMIGFEGLKMDDLFPYSYPSDAEMFELGLRGVHLSDYTYWEANKHAEMVIEKYGFKRAEKPFDRTYRKISNLDDIHENGVHDYMKWIKFGYGRCTDHASKDIRAGILSRDKAISLVKKHDHVKPQDLDRWLKYTEMTEKEFDAIADTFRDPRVWRYEKSNWVKDNIWD